MAKRVTQFLAAAIVTLLAYQVQAVTDPSRFTWHNWSRQVGKSFAASLRACLRAVGIGPGGKARRPRNQILISASQAQSIELMEKCKMHLQAVKEAFAYSEHDDSYVDAVFGKINFQRLEIRLGNGVRIIALPANPDTIRGYTGDVVLDEFAIHAKDRDIWAAAFWIVMRGGGCLDVWSTPKGRTNRFAQLRDNERFSHSTVTIEDAIAQGLDLDLQEVLDAFDDPELISQELYCEFLDDSTSLVTMEEILALEEYNLWPVIRDDDGIEQFFRTFRPTGRLYHGMDVGRKRDLTVQWLLEQVEGSNLLMTRAVIEQPKTRFRRQQEVLNRLLSLPGMAGSAIDETGIGMMLAEEAREDFGDWVEPVSFTPAVKSMLATRGRVRIEDRLVRIPVDKFVRDDIHSIKKIVTAAGNVRFDAERSDALGHADRFWALMLANYAASEDRSGPATWQFGPSREAARVGGLL